MKNFLRIFSFVVLIDDNFYKASTFYYRINLSGRDSIVYLQLTDDPKFVREIEVKLFSITNRQLFTEEMLGILSKKYGPCKEVKEMVFKCYEWRPDKYSQVLMRLFSNEASIRYTDEKKSIKKDSNKF